MKNRNTITPKTRTSVVMKRVLIFTVGAALVAGIILKFFVATVTTVASTNEVKAMFTPATGPLVSGHNWESTLTVSHSMVSGTADIVDFPLLISLNNADLRSIANGGHVASDFGYDILFCDDNNAQLSHDIESYDATTGDLTVWVNLPLLYASVDTELKITCGNENLTTDPSVDSTWSADFDAVWHMNEDPSLADINDAAGAFDGIPYGGMNSADLITGKIGGALDFDGSNDYLALENKNYTSSGTITQLTVSSWVRTTQNNDSWTSNWSILDFDRSEYFNFFVHGNGKISFCSRIAGGGIHDFHAGQSGQVNNGEWHHVVAVYDGTQKHLYIDGVLIQSVNALGISMGSGSTRYGFIGEGSEANSFNGGRNGQYFKGQLDEVRLYNVPLSTGRIITEYNNQSNPTEFVTMGNTVSNLPVELEYFKANLNDDAGRVYTKWSCLTQKNNDYFTIERSIDGNNFEEIGTVNGAGTTQQKEKYEFTDYDPAYGLSYYRLRQTDFDGKTETFNAIAVHYILPVEGVEIQNVWPNPFMNEFTVEYSLDVTSEVSISLYNSYGLQVFAESVFAEDGRNQYKFISNSDLSPGIYFLNITQNGNVLASKKLIKQ